MARAISRDPREYRRGMVLGLTLAETMLLLLFLLMMVAAAVVWRVREAADDGERRAEATEALIRPSLELLQRQGARVTDAVDLAQRLERLQAAEAERDALREALARAEATARAERTQHERAAAEVARLQRDASLWREAALRDVLAEAGRLDPARPAREVLAALVAQLAQQPEAGRPGATTALADRLARATEAERDAAEAVRLRERAEQQLAGLQAEIERLRAALARQGGAGEIYPSCWSSAGRPEFVFEIVLRNGGEVEVQDLAQAARRAEEPWARLGAFPRGAPIPIDAFLAAVRGMAEWSTQQRPECRFHVRVRNGLRPGSPMEEYNRVIGPLGNAASRHLPFYRVGG